MIFTGGFLGNMSGYVAGLVVIPLAGMISFLIYQLGMGVGGGSLSGEPSHHLRSFHRLSMTSPSGPESIYGDVPACARDVFVELRREDGEEKGRGCRGLLIRDDIIITSSECSKGRFTFDFAGYGIVRAVRHASLNSHEETVCSGLGFLEANPPYHYHFINHPVRRTRMFLSKQSNPAIVTCGVEHQPVAHGFPSENGEIVPLTELAGILPKDILWEETDLGTAPMLSYKSHRWWTRAITLGYEQETFKQMFDLFDGPPGSMSLPWAHSGFLGRAAALCEPLDPRGHRRDCWENYYKRWQQEEPFSGTHFFDWLDFGHGKFLLENNNLNSTLRYEYGDRWCKKRQFNAEKVPYFDDEKRDAHEIYFEMSEDGKRLVARYRNDNELVPPSEIDEPHLYMWDLDKKFYVVDDRWDEERYGRIKHTSVVAGRPGLSGGKAYFGEDGALWGINFSSGHYRPGIHAAAMMYQWMKDRGFNLTAFHFVGRDSWSNETCLKPHWEEIKITGFETSALNQSCYEMIANPMFMLKDDV